MVSRRGTALTTPLLHHFRKNLDVTILIDENASGGIPMQEYRRLFHTVGMSHEQMLMCGKVTHKNLIDNRLPFRNKNITV